ncbi:MAG: hypothetical protein ACJAZ2_001802 [Glaciecola sp.]|jgi:hypothetical protein
MKTNHTMKNLKKAAMFFMIAAGVLTGCKKEEDEDPHAEHEHEVMTDVTLTFTNQSDPSDVVAVLAQDPDGEGVEALKVIGSIDLDTSKSYRLTIQIANNLESPGEDIGAEVAEEDDEHQVFFSFNSNAFTNPAGDGNIDNASDAIDYNDIDGNGNPLGLSTDWATTSATLTGGTFRVVLVHQPGVKTGSSTVNDGDADFDLQFVLNIK